MLKDKIKKARTAAGFTQEEFAELLDVDRSTYTYYETGKTDIPVKLLVAASSVFNIAIEWFLMPEGDSGDQRAKITEPSNSLSCPNIFDPETFPQEDNGSVDRGNGVVAYTSDERVFLARYRILKDAGRATEIDKYMSKLMSNEMGKI